MSGQLPALSPGDIALREAEREIWLEERRQRDEQHRLEYECEQALELERQQAEWLSEHREAEAARQRERAESISRQVTQKELRDLRFQVNQHNNWQRTLEGAAVRQQQMQHNQHLLADLDASINPPPQPPEPETQVVYVYDDPLGSPNIGDDNFNPGYWSQKPIFRR
jgi:hypothetical protein